MTFPVFGANQNSVSGMNAWGVMSSTHTSASDVANKKTALGNMVPSTQYSLDQKFQSPTEDHVPRRATIMEKVRNFII